ncbi:MAG: hypothetical protein HY319_05790 [Armatimonadetes bacterium]|nr:hypothetical protein [Armatimonadota bacterium]
MFEISKRTSTVASSLGMVVAGSLFLAGVALIASNAGFISKLSRSLRSPSPPAV